MLTPYPTQISMPSSFFWLRSSLSFLTGIGLLLCLCCLLGCDSQDEPGDYRRSMHIPSGWKLDDNTQMLARSYPTDAWITVISRLKHESQRLFVSPYRTPPLPQSSFFLLGRRQPMSPSMPGEDKESSKKPVLRTYGFSYTFRSNRSVHLELRLPMRGRDQEERVYRYPFHLARTGEAWKTVRFLYRDFKPVDAKETRRMSPYFVTSVEFWEQPVKTNPPSLTLTIEGPFLYQSKKPLPPTSRPVSRPTSSPTSRPTSRPTKSSPSPTTSPQPTSRFTKPLRKGT